MKLYITTVTYYNGRAPKSYFGFTKAEAKEPTDGKVWEARFTTMIDIPFLKLWKTFWNSAAIQEREDVMSMVPGERTSYGLEYHCSEDMK